jgi:hypothetical protein
MPKRKELKANPKLLDLKSKRKKACHMLMYIMAANKKLAVNK